MKDRKVWKEGKQNEVAVEAGMAHIKVKWFTSVVAKTLLWYV